MGGVLKNRHQRGCINPYLLLIYRKDLVSSVQIKPKPYAMCLGGRIFDARSRPEEVQYIHTYTAVFSTTQVLASFVYITALQELMVGGPLGLPSLAECMLEKSPHWMTL